MKINGIEYSYREIFDAWLISKNPTKEQKELADKRYTICSNCELKKPLIKNNRWSELCLGCGCPLNKKIFSTYFNSCPLKKWEECDKEHLEPPTEKKNKTLI